MDKIKKLVITFLTTVVLFAGLGNLNVYADESCGILVNVGSTQAGGSYRVNAAIDTTNLVSGTTYNVVVSKSGILSSQFVTSFVANGSTLQESFDLAGSEGEGIIVGVKSVNKSSPSCERSATLTSTTTPNSNNNVPSSAPPVTGNNSSITCASDSNGASINTAIGCIPFNDQNALVGFILRWAIGIAGGIAFLLILIAGFQIISSRGDPKRLQAGQELMTSAIAGILLLIFSLVILRIIGFDILQIGAFQ